MKDAVTTMIQGGCVPAEPSETEVEQGSPGSPAGERGKKIDGVFYPKKERQIDRLGFEVTKHTLHFRGSSWESVLSSRRDDLTREFIQGAAAATNQLEENIQEVRFICTPHFLDVKCCVRHHVHTDAHDVQKELARFDWKGVKKLYPSDDSSKTKGKEGGGGSHSNDSSNRLKPPPAPTHAATANRKTVTGNVEEDDQFMANFKRNFLKEPREGDDTGDKRPTRKDVEKKSPRDPLQPRLSQVGASGVRRENLDGGESSLLEDGNSLAARNTLSTSSSPHGNRLAHHRREENDGRAGARRVARELSEYGRAHVGPDGIDFPEKGKDMDEEPEMITSRQPSTMIPVQFTA